MHPRISTARKMLTLSTGATHPLFLYGTAWKKDLTTSLVTAAINAGFPGIDTACQPRHYREDLVGAALSNLNREKLYIQTKFTSPGGQDSDSCPYNASAPVPEQVRQSIAVSLKNLGTEYIDSVLLHSPLRTAKDTLSAWRVLEEFVNAGKIKSLGISNVHINELKELYEEATIKPAIVQNRFYDKTSYDVAIRAFCRQNGMVWQSFWTLTANPELLGGRVVGGLAGRLGVSKAEALYLLVLSLGKGWENGGGVAIMNGTTNEGRMKADLEAVERLDEVTEEEISAFKRLVG